MDTECREAPKGGRPTCKTFEAYQTAAQRTTNNNLLHNDQLLNYALGLCGEAGEVAEKLKHMLFHGRDVPMQDIADELGDVLWYLTNIGTIFGFPLERIAQRNVEKLLERYPDGFKKEKSNG